MSNLYRRPAEHQVPGMVFAFAADILAAAACNTQPTRANALLYFTRSCAYCQTFWVSSHSYEIRPNVIVSLPAAMVSSVFCAWPTTSRQKRNSNNYTRAASLRPSSSSRLGMCGSKTRRKMERGRTSRRDRHMQSPTFPVGPPPCSPTRLHTTPVRLIPLNHTLAF